MTGGRRDPSTPLEIAWRLIQGGSPRAARTAVAQALAAQPDDPRVLSAVSAVRRSEGDAQGAVDYAQRATAIAPDDLTALQMLTLALLDAGRNEESLPISQRIIETAPEQPHAYRLRALALMRLKRPAEAAQAARRAIELVPDDPANHNELGNALLKARRYRDAASAYRTSVGLDPHTTLYRFNLALALSPAQRDPGGLMRRVSDLAHERPDMRAPTYVMGAAYENVLGYVAGILGAELGLRIIVIVLAVLGTLPLPLSGTATTAFGLIVLAAAILITTIRMGRRRRAILRSVLGDGRHLRIVTVLEAIEAVLLLPTGMLPPWIAAAVAAVGVGLMAAVVVQLQTKVPPPPRLW